MSLRRKVEILAKRCEGLGVDARIEFALILARRLDNDPDETPAGVIRELRVLIQDLENRATERSDSRREATIDFIRSA